MPFFIASSVLIDWLLNQFKAEIINENALEAIKNIN